MDKNDIKELTRDDLVLWLEQNGIRPFHAGQIFKWIYLRNVNGFEEMTDLSKSLRKLLSANFSIHRLRRAADELSADGSKKYLFKLVDGHHIESVLIQEKNHYTMCISTQVGCAQGCRFCMTASGGFKRNLTTGEIIAQIRDIQADLSYMERPSNVVLMGMGEPLANYENVINALKIMTDTDFGLKFSSRRVTLSTVGIVPRFQDLGRDTPINIAVSLNATDNETRSMLMPINRKYPIEVLLEACRNYPLAPRRKITFEYILIKGINDTTKDAKRLATLLRPLKAKINLIPFNEHENSDFKCPDDDKILEFQNLLHNYGYSAIIRYSKGRDISAACGQLGARNDKG